MTTLPNPYFEGGGTKPKLQLERRSQILQKPPKKVKFKTPEGDARSDYENLADKFQDFSDPSQRFAANTYSKPEFHSTLLLAEKLQSVRLESFNESEAVSKKLKECDKVRKTVVHKSVKHVNIPPSVTVFKDLIPLEFDEESLLRAAAEKKEANLRHLQPKLTPKDPEPEIEEFFTPDLQPEFVTVPSPKFNFEHLLIPVMPTTTNRLYIHRRNWENLP